ncbi:MAG: hypothetical protein KC910_33300 [Candidatus Eremiobacteraeota bacterium]|nr:hypothetical protein [Candidatus Eremiobacteraeota bacterium]
MLPPLTPQELAEFSDRVIEGTIESLTQAVVEVKDGNNIVYQARLEGEDFTFWQVDHRPMGWAGPCGQLEIPRQGQRGRAYLRSDSGGKLHLLEPNGWLPL